MTEGWNVLIHVIFCCFLFAVVSSELRSRHVNEISWRNCSSFILNIFFLYLNTTQLHPQTQLQPAAEPGWPERQSSLCQRVKQLLAPVSPSLLVTASPLVVFLKIVSDIVSSSFLKNLIWIQVCAVVSGLTSGQVSVTGGWLIHGRSLLGPCSVWWG